MRAVSNAIEDLIQIMIDAYVLRGNVYLTQEKYELAEADDTKSIQLDPSDADVYNIRGSIYLIQKEYKLARKN